MTHRRVPIVFALVLGGFALWTTPLRADLLGINRDGQVNNINVATGAGTVIGNSGVTETFSLASNTTGTFYTVDLGTGTPRLDTINPSTGVATVGQALTGLGVFTFVNGLTFSPGGVLYLTGFSGSMSSLFTVNTVTGAATSIGTISSALITDLAFSPSGTLYGWDFSNGLATVNTTTGAGTLVQSNLGGLPEIFSLRFNPSGTLYGAGTSFYTVNPNTSALTLVGPVGTDIRGLAFTPQAVAVPEPGSLISLASGLVLLGLLHRRRLREKPPSFAKR